MGGPKSGMTLGGRPVLRYLLGRWHWPGPTLLVTAPGREHPPGWEAFDAEATDAVAGVGPLQGVLTAVEAATTPLVIVTPVDMPNVGRGLLDWLLATYPAKVERQPGLVGMLPTRPGPDGGALIEPLPAIFHRSAAAVVRTHLATGRRSLHGLAKEPTIALAPSPPDLAAACWINLNTPDDLQAFEQSEGDRPADGPAATTLNPKHEDSAR